MRFGEVDERNTQGNTFREDVVVLVVIEGDKCTTNIESPNGRRCVEQYPAKDALLFLDGWWYLCSQSLPRKELIQIFVKIPLENSLDELLGQDYVQHWVRPACTEAAHDTFGVRGGVYAGRQRMSQRFGDKCHPK